MLIKLGNYHHQIVDRWFESVRNSLRIPLSDTELIDWLNQYFCAFMEQLDIKSYDLSNQLFSDLTHSLIEQGLQPSDAINLMLLFPQILENSDCFDKNDFLDQRLCSQIYLSINQNVSDFMNSTVSENLQQQKRTATLLKVAKAASSSLDLETVMRTISDEIVKALDALRCNTFLFPAKSKYGNYYLLDILDPAFKVPDPPERFCLEALSSQEPVICYDAALDPRTDKETVRFFDLKSLMAFPLVSKGKTIAVGLIVMKDYHHFTKEEIELVKGIANSTAVAIENAQLYEKTKQLAIIEERSRIAVEMHDNIAQALAIIKMDAASLLKKEVSDSTRVVLEEIKSLANDSYTDLRSAIFSLDATPESDTNILDNFKNFLSVFGFHSGLRIDFELGEKDLSSLSREAVLHLIRIMEEALKNVRKHAGAKNVWVRSNRSDGWIHIAIEDDGIGMDNNLLKNYPVGHFGLRVMRERAESVGGKFSIYNRSDKGTCVAVDLPVQK